MLKEQMKFTNRKKLKDFSEKRKIELFELFELFELLFKRLGIYIEEIEEMILKLQPEYYEWYNKVVS